MPQSNPTVVILGADFGGLKNKDCISQLKRCWAIATAFHASSVVPTLLREIWAVPRTYAQEIEKRSVKNNSSMHRNGGKLRGVLSAEPALMFRGSWNFSTPAM